jgi:hypothetical protein
MTGIQEIISPKSSHRAATAAVMATKMIESDDQHERGIVKRAAAFPGKA